MSKIEKLAAKYEVTCDYIIEEFALDGEIYSPTMFLVETEEEFFFFDFKDDVKSVS